MQFYLDDKLFESGEKKKSTLKCFKFRGRLRRRTCLDISEIKAAVRNELKEIGGTEGRNDVTLRDLNLLIPST